MGGAVGDPNLYGYSVGGWQQWTDTQTPTIAPEKPNSVSSGDLLLVYTSSNTHLTASPPTGWFEWEDDGPGTLYGRVADGTSTDDFSLTWNSSDSGHDGHAQFAAIHGVGLTGTSSQFASRTFVGQTVSDARYKITSTFNQTSGTRDVVVAVAIYSGSTGSTTACELTGGPIKFSDGSAANLQTFGSDNVIDTSPSTSTRFSVWGFQLNKLDPTSVSVAPGRWTRTGGNLGSSYVVTAYRFNFA